MLGKIARFLGFGARRTTRDDPLDRLSIGSLLALHQMDYQWFLRHQHLPNDELLRLRLIDTGDLAWVNQFRTGSTPRPAIGW